MRKELYLKSDFLFNSFEIDNSSKYIRSSAWFQNFSDYFPVKIVKTVDLPPTQNYLFGVFPHGVIR